MKGGVKDDRICGSWVCRHSLVPDRVQKSKTAHGDFMSDSAAMELVHCILPARKERRNEMPSPK